MHAEGIFLLLPCRCRVQPFIDAIKIQPGFANTDALRGRLRDCFQRLHRDFTLLHIAFVFVFKIRGEMLGMDARRRPNPIMHFRKSKPSLRVAKRRTDGDAKNILFLHPRQHRVEVVGVGGKVEMAMRVDEERRHNMNPSNR